MASPPAPTPSAGRPLAARSDEAREALLAAAHDLLANEGPAALTVRRIAAAAGMSTMNVYSRFGGKDGVVDELFVAGFRRLGAAMAATPTTDDPAADLIACGNAYQEFARRNPTYYSVMFDRVVPDFEPSERAVEYAQNALARVVDRVQRAIDAGQIRAGDPFTMASALWSCVHGLASLRARTPPGQLDLFDWDAISEMATEAFVRGLAPAT